MLCSHLNLLSFPSTLSRFGLTAEGDGGEADGFDGRAEDAEGAGERLVHRHHRRRIVELAAVVRGGEDGDEFAVGEELVASNNDRERARKLIEKATHPSCTT